MWGVALENQGGPSEGMIGDVLRKLVWSRLLTAARVWTGSDTKRERSLTGCEKPGLVQPLAGRLGAGLDSLGCRLMRQLWVTSRALGAGGLDRIRPETPVPSRTRWPVFSQLNSLRTLVGLVLPATP